MNDINFSYFSSIDLLIWQIKKSWINFSFVLVLSNISKIVPIISFISLMFSTQIDCYIKLYMKWKISTCADVDEVWRIVYNDWREKYGIFSLNKNFTRGQWRHRYEAQFFRRIALWLPLQSSLWEVPFVGTTLRFRRRATGSFIGEYRGKTFGNELPRSKGEP